MPWNIPAGSSFSKWTDTQTIEQAERQADWLSEWIGSAIGEPVAAGSHHWPCPDGLSNALH
jgi:hypothetical protein